MNSTRQLAIVTGASTGIGFELAKLRAANGFDPAAFDPLLLSRRPPL